MLRKEEVRWAVLGVWAGAGAQDQNDLSRDAPKAAEQASGLQIADGVDFADNAFKDLGRNTNPSGHLLSGLACSRFSFHLSLLTRKYALRGARRTMPIKLVELHETCPWTNCECVLKVPGNLSLLG
jgi:hypothetical protein